MGDWLFYKEKGHLMQHQIDSMRQDVYVCCFSEVWDSILMWAHYANNYKSGESLNIYRNQFISYEMRTLKSYKIYTDTI